MPGEWIDVGRVLKPHGIHGGMKIEVLSDNPERFTAGAELWLKGERREVTGVKTLNDALVITVNGITTPEEVEQFRNEYLRIPEERLSPLPAGRFYRFELVGMQACTLTGEPFGTVSDVINNAGSDLVEVKMAGGKTALFPLRQQMMGGINREKRTIAIDLDFFNDAL